MKLDYEVTGLENMPQDNRCIYAAKHQSAWETVKLHLLFNDPVIVLKKELQYIPIFGWYIWRTGMIAVKRKRRGQAISSLLEGARHALEQNRSIVIFPQGTRTAVGKKMPYKRGISALYEELNIPIVPIALNSGIFWGRKSFKKKSGTITVEFLPIIPAGLSTEEMMEKLQTSIETASTQLEKNALSS